MARLGGKSWTWLLYIPSVVASVLFAIISLVTFGDLAQVQYDSNAGKLGSQLNGAMAGTFMAPVLTAGIIILSFFVLIRKTWSQDGAGFTYGFTASWFLQSCCFLLLTGVVLTANKHWTYTFEAAPTGVWASSATNAYVATYVLAFICAAFHLVMAVAMISNRRSFGGARLTVDELGLSDRLRGSTPRSSAVPEAGSPAPPFTYPVPHASSAPAGTGAWNSA